MWLPQIYFWRNCNVRDHPSNCFVCHRESFSWQNSKSWNNLKNILKYLSNLSKYSSIKLSLTETAARREPIIEVHNCLLIHFFLSLDILSRILYHSSNLNQIKTEFLSFLSRPISTMAPDNQQFPSNNLMSVTMPTRSAKPNFFLCLDSNLPGKI